MRPRGCRAGARYRARPRCAANRRRSARHGCRSHGPHRRRPTRPDAARTALRVAPTRASRCRSRMISSAASGSRLATGSSAKRTRGRCASARAMATRCAWPPDRVPARCSARSARPTSARWSRAASSSTAGRPANTVRNVEYRPSAPLATLANTLLRRTRLACCQTIASSRRARRSFSPSSAQRLVSPSQTSPAAGLQGPGDATQQRGLAAAIAAKNDDKLARLDLQIKVGQGELAVRIAQRKIANSQHRSVTPKASAQLLEIDIEGLNQIADADRKPDRSAARTG